MVININITTQNQNLENDIKVLEALKELVIKYGCTITYGASTFYKVEDKNEEPIAFYAGKQLKKVRQQLGLNQAEMANELNLSQPYFCSIEVGRKKISVKMIDAIKKKYGISLIK